MKKIVLFTLALAFAVSANAQNRWYVEGSLGADYAKVKGVDASSTFSITPSVHYMFNENWAVGLGVGYTYVKNSSILIGNEFVEFEKENVFSVAPSLTYFMKLGEKFYYTPEFTIFYSRFNESKVNRFGAAIAPLSFEFRPTDCIGINFAAGNLGFASTKAKGGDALSQLNFNLNTGATVAFRFYF